MPGFLPWNWGVSSLRYPNFGPYHCHIWNSCRVGPWWWWWMVFLHCQMMPWPVRIEKSAAEIWWNPNVYQIQHIRMLWFFQKLLHLRQKKTVAFCAKWDRGVVLGILESKEQTKTYGASGKVIMIPSIRRREGSGPWLSVCRVELSNQLKKRILAYLRSRKFPIKKQWL